MLPLLMNETVQTVAQHHTDFLTVNHVELCHYILYHFHFNHLHSVFPIVLVVADLHYVTQAIYLVADGKFGYSTICLDFAVLHKICAE